MRESDKQAVLEKAAGAGYQEGQYLDINLYKIIGEDRTKISQTLKTVRIVIAIPESLKNTDSGKTRSYAVVRVHDGVSELLADMDTDEATVTIETDQFSTYALVYKDTAKPDDQKPDDGGSGSGDGGNSGGDGGNSGSGDGGNGGSGSGSGSGNGNGGNSGSGDGGSSVNPAQKDDEPKTGDTAPIEIYATLAMISGLFYLMLLYGSRKKSMTEQEKKERVASIVAWGREGGRLRKAAAITAIFLILVYYHSIGKKISTDWKEVYGE